MTEVPRRRVDRTEKLAADRYRIDFSCSPGPMIGDGGTWEARFREDGSVEEIQPIMRWIS